MLSNLFTVFCWWYPCWVKTFINQIHIAWLTYSKNTEISKRNSGCFNENQLPTMLSQWLHLLCVKHQWVFLSSSWGFWNLLCIQVIVRSFVKEMIRFFCRMNKHRCHSDSHLIPSLVMKQWPLLFHAEYSSHRVKATIPIHARKQILDDKVLCVALLWPCGLTLRRCWWSSWSSALSNEPFPLYLEACLNIQGAILAWRWSFTISFSAHDYSFNHSFPLTLIEDLATEVTDLEGKARHPSAMPPKEFRPQKVFNVLPPNSNSPSGLLQIPCA